MFWPYTLNFVNEPNGNEADGQDWIVPNPKADPVKEKNDRRHKGDVLDLSSAKDSEDLFRLRQDGAYRVFEESLGRHLMSVPQKFGLSDDLLGPRLEFLLEGTYQFAMPELRHFAANFDGVFISELFASLAQKVSQCSGCMTPFCAHSLRLDPANTQCTGGHVSDIAVVVSAVLNLKPPQLGYSRRVIREIKQAMAKADPDLEDAFLSILKPRLHI